MATAVDRLLQKFENSGILVSVHPTLGIRCLRHLGCPPQVCNALTMIWVQERWLSFNGEYLDAPVRVTTSLPQRDAVSPLTLLALLSGVTRHVKQQERSPHTLATHLDDRNFVAASPEQAARLCDYWRTFSRQVGLWENDSKLKLVCRNHASPAGTRISRAPHCAFCSSSWH